MKLILICCLAALLVCAQGKSLDNDLLRKIKILLQERDEISAESAETAEKRDEFPEKRDEISAESEEAVEKRDEFTEDIEEEGIMSEEMVGKSLFNPANYYDTAHTLVQRSAENYDSNQCMHEDGTSETQSVKDCSLYAHNTLRQMHGTPALTWDDALAQKSKEHAKWMAENLKLEHSVSSGENIAVKALSTGDYFSGAAPMVKAWYNEVVNPGYDFEANVQGKAGHFTQVVWKGTQKVGCGIARTVVDGWNRVYYCCQYSPAGNMAKQYVNNVPKPAVVKAVLSSDIEKNGKCNFFTKCLKYKKACNIVKEACPESCNC